MVFILAYTTHLFLVLHNTLTLLEKEQPLQMSDKVVQTLEQKHQKALKRAGDLEKKIKLAKLGLTEQTFFKNWLLFMRMIMMAPAVAKFITEHLTDYTRMKTKHIIREVMSSLQSNRHPIPFTLALDTGYKVSLSATNNLRDAVWHFTQPDDTTTTLEHSVFLEYYPFSDKEPKYPPIEEDLKAVPAELKNVISSLDWCFALMVLYAFKNKTLLTKDNVGKCFLCPFTSDERSAVLCDDLSDLLYQMVGCPNIDPTCNE